MLFGIAHAYLIWHGDILYPYALLGLILFPLHKARPKWLLVTAGVCVLGMTGFQVIGGFRMQKTHRLAIEAEKAIAEKKTLTDEQKKAQTEWENMRKYVNPSQDDLKKEHEMYSGGYFHLVGERAALVKEARLAVTASGWDARDDADRHALAKMGCGGRALAPLHKWMAVADTWWIADRKYCERSLQAGIRALQTVFVFTTYQAARIAMTFGHAGVLLLICKRGMFGGLQRRLAGWARGVFELHRALADVRVRVLRLRLQPVR